ncbi:MAG: NAD(+) synthase [Candidatus Moranbacteria bacterium]|nr:NAD(+) synthase [Candidatus Moranbacteria bacterium]
MEKINEAAFYKKIREEIVQYIRDFVKDKSVIVGLSGGIDSSIVCALAVEALGKDKVKALIVKNSRYSESNLQTSRDYAKKLGIETQEINSNDLRSGAIREIGIHESNIIEVSTMDARICDTIIKTYAGMEDRIYLGTINGTERLTGWYPKGNLVGDCCPIGGLLKEQEKELAKEMGLGYLIETISEDASRVCSGCGELPVFKGIPYSTLDEVLYIYETSNKDELKEKLEKANIDQDVSSRILNRIDCVVHKSDVFPEYYKINFPNEK